MPSFVNMASLTKLASLTGNEEFQVSATQKVTAQQIADLAPKGVNSVVVTNFGSKTWTGGKTMTQMALGEIQAFTCAAGATGAPTNTAYGGIMQKTTASSLTYYACNPMSTNGGKSIWIATVLSVGSGITWNKISYDSEQGVPIMEVGDFTTINDVWPTETEPGRVAAFYTGTEVYSQPEAGETQYVGFVILDSDFNDNFSATVIAFARSSGKQYIGRLGFTEQVIDWYQYPTNPITLMSFRDLMSTTTFADMKQGEMKAFYSPNAGGADAPSGYSSSLFGYIQKTNTPAGIWIFAYGNTGNASAERKMWIGFATSSATKWTAVGGGGGLSFLHGEEIIEGLEYMIPENVGDVVAFRISADSSQVPNTTEGFGLLGKINGSESLLMAVQINPNNTYEELFYTGRVQNDGSGTDWHPIGISTATGMNFPKKLLSSFTGVLDKIGEGDTLMVLLNIVGTGTAMSNGGNMIGYLQVGSSLIGKEQTLYYGRDINDQSIVRVLAELNSFDTDGAEFTFYMDDPAGILDATLIKVYKLPK
jgi:hypothetical protein